MAPRLPPRGGGRPEPQALCRGDLDRDLLEPATPRAPVRQSPGDPPRAPRRRRLAQRADPAEPRGTAPGRRAPLPRGGVALPLVRGAPAQGSRRAASPPGRGAHDEALAPAQRRREPLEERRRGHAVRPRHPRRLRLARRRRRPAPLPRRVRAAREPQGPARRGEGGVGPPRPAGRGPHARPLREETLGPHDPRGPPPHGERPRRGGRGGPRRRRHHRRRLARRAPPGRRGGAGSALRHAEGPPGPPPPLPGEGRHLAPLPPLALPGQLPRRRHGPRQDDPGSRRPRASRRA